MKNFQKSWIAVFAILIVTLVLAFLPLTSFANEVNKPVKAQSMEEKVRDCAIGTILKGYGWSALYGGLIIGGTTAIGIAVAPVSMPASVAAGTIVYNTGMGALLGVGSSAVTRISDEVEFKSQHLVDACVKKIEKKSKEAEKSLKDAASKAKQGLSEGAAKTAEAGASALERAKQLVK